MTKQDPKMCENAYSDGWCEKPFNPDGVRYTQEYLDVWEAGREDMRMECSREEAERWSANENFQF